MDSRLNIEFDVFQTNVQVIYGDLMEVDTDIIVSADDTYLLASSGVSKRIRESAGKRRIFRDIHKYSLPIPAGSIVVTGGGNLQAKHIFHVAALDLDKHFKSYQSAHKIIQNIVNQAIRIASALQAETLVTPLLVTDKISVSGKPSIVSQLTGLPENQLLDLLLRNLSYCLATANYPVSLRQIIIALYEEGLEDESQIEQQIISDLNNLKDEVIRWSQRFDSIKWIVDANQLLSSMKDEQHRELCEQLEAKVRSVLDELSDILINEDRSINSVPSHAKMTEDLQIWSEEEYQHKRERWFSSLQETDIDIDSLQKETTIRHKRLEELNQKSALFGFNTPAEITIEIQEIEKRLDQVPQELSALYSHRDDIQLQLNKLDEYWKAQKVTRLTA